MGQLQPAHVAFIDTFLLAPWPRCASAPLAAAALLAAPLLAVQDAVTSVPVFPALWVPHTVTMSLLLRAQLGDEKCSALAAPEKNAVLSRNSNASLAQVQQGSTASTPP